MTDVVTTSEDVVVAVPQPVTPPTAPPVKIGLVEIKQVVQSTAIGGAATGDTPPPAPIDGQMWWKSSDGTLYVYYDDGNSQQWLQVSGGGGSGGVAGSGDLSGFTVDTGEHFRLIMLSNGSVFAIPYAAVAPAAPTGLLATVRLTSVNLTWSTSSGATSYVVKRDGVEVGTTSDRSFRDTNILIGTTYSYTVSSVDRYQQRSLPSTPATAFIDPALNTAPTDVTITCWPTPIPTDGPAFVRVNAREIDVQMIAYTLGVDAGSLTATADPSVWVLRI